MTQKTIGKRGALGLGEAPTAISILIVLAVTIAIGAFIVQEIQDSEIVQDDNVVNATTGNIISVGTSGQITNSSLNALLDFGNFQGIIAIAIVAAIVLGLIAFLRT